MLSWIILFQGIRLHKVTYDHLRSAWFWIACSTCASLHAEAPGWWHFHGWSATSLGSSWNFSEFGMSKVHLPSSLISKCLFKHLSRGWPVVLAQGFSCFMCWAPATYKTLSICTLWKKTFGLREWGKSSRKQDLRSHSPQHSQHEANVFTMVRECYPKFTSFFRSIPLLKFAECPALPLIGSMQQPQRSLTAGWKNTKGCQTVKANYVAYSEHILQLLMRII